MKLLQGKPLHVRKRIVIIATGSIAIVLVLTMIYVYAKPRAVQHDPEKAIVAGYTTVLSRLQSHHSSK